MIGIIAKAQTFGFIMSKKQRVSENVSISCLFALSRLGQCFWFLVLYFYVLFLGCPSYILIISASD